MSAQQGQAPVADGGGAAVAEAASENTYPGTLFDYTAGCFCGVLVTESVMRKLAKLQAEHLEQVKRVLHDSEGSVFPSMWTLHYPGGEQVSVHYIDTSREVRDAIRNATTSNPPRPKFPVFIAGSMDAAREMADARCAAGEPA